MLLSKVEPHRSAWAVLIDNTRVSLGQLGDSFSKDGWVEAYVINVFCRILFRDRHPRQSKKHCFFTTVSDYFLEKWRNEGARKMIRSRALASFDGAGKALPLYECDRLLFPSVHESHWFLFVVDFITRKFIFLDSLHGTSSDYHTEIKDKKIQNFINTWEETKLRRMGFKNFGIAYPNLPKQVERFVFLIEDEQGLRKTGGKGARQRLKLDDEDGRSSSSKGPCLSDGGGGSDGVGGGRRKKLRLAKEQCSLLEDSFRANNILSHVSMLRSRSWRGG